MKNIINLDVRAKEYLTGDVLVQLCSGIGLFSMVSTMRWASGGQLSFKLLF